ncbi:MAG: hypothetical protein IJ877_01025, partial [Candidatus Gastranaerophilales bacterium]|nr:hypothetical protein [Candidatus Gastranaerophilales bacterium]
WTGSAYKTWVPTKIGNQDITYERKELGSTSIGVSYWTGSAYKTWVPTSWAIPGLMMFHFTTTTTTGSGTNQTTVTHQHYF